MSSSADRTVGACGSDQRYISSMLEDKSISHLISWTPSSESFVMQPSHEFSKVLAYVFPLRKPRRLVAVV